MAKNSKKKRNQTPQDPKANEATQPQHSPWPNLPRQLKHYIAMQPSLLHSITSFGCIIKSWRSPSALCNSHFPKLVEIIDRERIPRTHIVDVKFHDRWPWPYYKPERYNILHHPGNIFKGFSQGHVVIIGADDKDPEIYLWKPEDSCTRSLPRWDQNVPFKSCTVSWDNQDYHHRGLKAMVLTGISSPAFGFYPCKKGENSSWDLQECNIKEPYAPNEKMKFTNGIEFKGKFYALSLQGTLVEIETNDTVSSFDITRVGGARAVPAKASRQFREYMLESNGEILLVFLVSRRSITVVEDVEVYRLDVEKLLWVRVEGIGERALFLEDECCMSVLAGEIGCVKNSVYFMHDRVGDQQWRIYDMETKEISRVDEIREGVMWGEPTEKIRCRCEIDYRHW